jgi:hypothetical protein
MSEEILRQLRSCRMTLTQHHEGVKWSTSYCLEALFGVLEAMAVKAFGADEVDSVLEGLRLQTTGAPTATAEGESDPGASTGTTDPKTEIEPGSETDDTDPKPPPGGEG